MNTNSENSEIATGNEVGDNIEITSHEEAHVPIQGSAFQTPYRNVGYRHDNGPAWNSWADYAAFETPHGKVVVGSHPINMYGYPFSLGDRIHVRGGASVRVIRPASSAPNPSNPVPRGEVYVLGTHRYHSEKAGRRDGLVEVTLDQALLNLLPVANAALSAGAESVTLCYTRSFAPAIRRHLPHGAGEELRKAVDAAIEAAWAALPKSSEEPVEHPDFPGVKIPPALARVLDTRGLREVSRCLWEGKGGSEVNAWADTLTQDQMDWVLAQFTPHAKVFDDVREEWEGLKAKWAGKSYSAV